MRRRHFLSLFAVPALLPAGASALTLQEIPHPRAAVRAPADAVSWDLLGEAGPLQVADAALSRFPAELRALGGTEVKLYGYLYPLEEGPAHRQFLLGGLAYHCGLCLLSDPTQLVLATAAQPVAYQDEPVLVQGRLELVEDPDSRLFYRLTGARAA